MKVPFNLSLLLPLLSALVAQGAAQALGALEALGRGVQKEIADAKQPIEEVAVTIASGQCAQVKKLIGVDYEQIEKEGNEPDLNNLNLVFRTRDIHITFNLTKAAALLPAARGYNATAPLILFMHGFTDDPSQANFGYISDAFLSVGEYNILGLDASSLIRWLYLRSTTYVRFIGERLGEVLAALVHKGLSPKAIHLIGHSLGAHIAGFTGKQFSDLTGGRVGRVSGLDPAGPCYSTADKDLRLDANDADFVDVIHTNGGVFGIVEPIGHVDFFPNEGSLQPGCVLQTCSHSRVTELYAESITRRGAFLARGCRDHDAFKSARCTEDLVEMGYYCPRSVRGTYYLNTGEESPFGLGRAGASWEKTKGRETIVSTLGNVGSKLLG